MRKRLHLFFYILLISILNISCQGSKTERISKSKTDTIPTEDVVPAESKETGELQRIDEADYLERITRNANGDTTGWWPVKDQPIPLEGALLPYKRIIAYYGNLYSKNMGALGEYPPAEMWERLNKEVEAWQAADPETPAVPAIHYIATVAQGSPIDGKWRARMPEHQIDSALAIAKMQDALLFLDIQVGMSTVEKEVPVLEKYLRMPHVHLGIDPEFSMKDGTPPGKKIGTFDATDINYCTEYLAKLVQENNLPPKVLVIHRFRRTMITNYKKIILRPEVQIVIDMDGFGNPKLKYSTYENYIHREPIQFTGFKLFYKNDVKQAPHHMLTPEELLELQPQPVYIQYQ